MNNTETYAFSADINQLLSLIINTFYSNKDIFLRELISNSSDALDKIRHKSLTDSSILGDEKELKIRISFNKQNRILIIEDTGIGMTKDELIKNLGTIAKSGTKSFLETLTSSDDITCIGQFGVGFYSSYLVADKVDVISKHNDDETFMWSSIAGGSFSVVKPDYELKRGTKLVLYLKEDMDEYLEENKIKELIKKHNQFINYPIYLECEKTKEVEVDDEKVEEIEEKESSHEVKVEEVEVEDVEEEKEENSKKTKTETYYEYEEINKEKPIWTLNPKDVSNEQYCSFYKAISNDYDDHLDVIHFAVEGQIEFRGILYIPNRTPFDIFDNNKKPNNIKLYVRKVFISDDSTELVPDYLRFVSGVVDSDDLPLNISREMLQQNKIMRVIKKNIIKKCLEMITNISEDEGKFSKFYEQFSKNIKLGIHEDSTYRQKLATFLRYETTKSEKACSLDEYISRMKEDQKGIYYITGESKKSIEHSPFLEKLKANDLEVIYMVDPLDEYITQQLKDYNDKKLICITKENLIFEENKEEIDNMTKEYEGVCKFIKETLGDKIEKAVISTRLDKSPCVLVTSEYGWTANMERIMKAQALRNNDMGFNMAKYTLEINPNNKIINTMKSKLGQEDEIKSLRDLTYMLYDITLLSSGLTLDDPSTFSNRILKLINIGLGIDEEDEDEDKGEISLQSEDKEVKQENEESIMEYVD